MASARKRLAAQCALTRPFFFHIVGTTRLLSILTSVLFISRAAAINLTWDSGNTNDGVIIDPANGTWDLNASNLIWNNAGINQAWANGNAAIFGGADGSYDITIGAAISASSITISNSGYTLLASNVETITTSGNPFLILAPGKTGTIGTNVTVNTSGSSVVGAGAGGADAGMLMIGSGGFLTSSKAMLIDGAGTLVNVLTGGTLTTASATASYLSVGSASGDNATLLVNGGSVTIQRNTGSIWVPAAAGPAAVTNAAGTLTITNGGVVTETGGFVSLGEETGDVGTLNLDGGTLITAAITGGSGTGVAGTGVGIVNFNGGILEAQQAATNYSFVGPITAAYLRNGGAVIDNNGFAVTIGQSLLHSTNVADSAIDGGLECSGSGTLTLTGTNTYTGPTLVSGGTLALANNDTSSANVDVTRGTLDVSGMAGAVTLDNLNMTNAAINVGATTVGILKLSMGGVSNTINIAALPGFLIYPTNVTLIRSGSSINGYNFVLGNLPVSSPTYAGSLAENGNAVVLTLSSGPLSVVHATVSFSPTNPGLVLNPAFCGLSYEKDKLIGSLFVSNDTSLVSMFSQIAPAVLRVGGHSVDTTCWGGVSNLTPITAADVDAFAGFVKSLPANWHVIYGINMSVNSPTNCAAEAAYVANALGPHLLGFEIGNEPDLYSQNIRSSSYTFADFLSQWQALAAAITNAVPGWAITNGGNGWTLTGPAAAGNTTGYTVPFAGDETGVVSMLTQHYYLASGQSPSSTIEYLLQPDPNLPVILANVVGAATTANLPLGFRMDECGSYYDGGAPNVSDAYGAALWSLDFMFTCALNGCQGINFHGGGDGAGYTPIADNGSSVVQARPEFYGLKMFSLADNGNVIPASVTLASNINFTTYGIRRPNGGISALLNNKDTNDSVQVSINFGSYVSAAQAIELTCTNLNNTNNYTLGGAVIEPDGSWAGGVQSVTPATNGQLTFIVPPISAVLLNPVILPTNITTSVAGNQLNLSWPSNYTGWLLQSNSSSLLASNAWFTVPDSAGTDYIQITINPNQASVFYRLICP